MEKVLVGIHAASLGRRYDAFVPTDMQISRVIPVITDAIAELTYGKYESSGMELLSLQEPEALLDPSLTLDDYQIRDGMQLFLI